MQQSAIISNVLNELADLIAQMSSDEYTMRSVNLSGATIGQHTRHIIELFQCLYDGYNGGTVNYEKRKRDIRIETDKDVAILCMEDILSNICKEDKHLMLDASFAGDTKISVNSSYNRELIYNLEHAIHHMALIRVGILELTSISLSEKFGVAPSTIEYRRKCAQ
jgi:hypothetical protein